MTPYSSYIYRACVKSLLCTKSLDDDMMTILWSCGTHTYRNTWQNVSASNRSKHKRTKYVLIRRKMISTRELHHIPDVWYDMGKINSSWILLKHIFTRWISKTQFHKINLTSEWKIETMCIGPNPNMHFTHFFTFFRLMMRLSCYTSRSFFYLFLAECEDFCFFV